MEIAAIFWTSNTLYIQNPAMLFHVTRPLMFTLHYVHVAVWNTLHF